MTGSSLRGLPGVDRVLQELGATALPRPLVVDVVRRHLRLRRAQADVPPMEQLLDDLRRELSRLHTQRLQPLINGTGVLVHTNFGRAPLGEGVTARLAEIAASYNTLEFDVDTGSRGGRAAYLERALAVLCGAESATVVNNNAAALVLLVGQGRRAGRSEVVISRGELIQIGGGFRIPDILEASGVRLREVGTTNQTTLDDYAQAVSPATALILKVHRSNFFMDGFVASPSTADLAGVARRAKVPLIEDLGSGAMFDTAAFPGLEPEPTPARRLKERADAVCFSGDKLLGGPQAGIIVGRARLIAAVKRAPLFRAFRCDKLVLAALEATVDLHLDDGEGVPVLQMLRADLADLQARALRIVAALDGLPLVATVAEGKSQIGGGALPRSAMPSVVIDLQHRTRSAHDLARRLRSQAVPVVGYVARGALRIDLRTVFPRQDEQLCAAIRAAAE